MRPRETAVDLRATLSFPESVTIPVNIYNDFGSLATAVISPQGDKVAFTGVKDGQGALYLRRMDRRVFPTPRMRAQLSSPRTGIAWASSPESGCGESTCPMGFRSRSG